MMKNLGGPSREIVEATKRVIAAAEAIADPIDRERALKRAAECVPDLQNELRLARAAAIREAITTRSAVDVAAELGISRSRLYKVLDDAGDGWITDPALLSQFPRRQLPGYAMQRGPDGGLWGVMYESPSGKVQKVRRLPGRDDD